jgi:sugar/nucleoside kinase (ribokinase family)
VIVVVGSPVFAPGSGGARNEAAGLAAETAEAAARAGATVQLVGKVGDDPGGDEVLLALHQAGVGHAAVLRDAAHSTPRVALPVPATDDEAMDPAADADNADARLPTGLALEAADLELALRYLTDFRVLVLADELDAAIRTVALDAAAFSGAHVVDLHADDGVPGPDAEHLTAFDSADADPAAFGQMAGRYAAGLDAGRAPAAAFADATRSTRWEAATD